MNAAVPPSEAVIDLAFPLQGQQLSRDHGQALAEALRGQLPWWRGDDDGLAVHPIKVVPGEGDVGLLSQRARLRLRVALSRQPEVTALSGCTLDVKGHLLAVGRPKPFKLVPHGTLKSAFVAASCADEAVFMREVVAELEALGVSCLQVCGRPGQMQLNQQPVPGFSLMLHGLSAADSLQMQRMGLGPHRALGCGIFVPHRSASAVGS